MFDTKIVIVLRDDLLVWQKLNVTAFLMSGLAGGQPQIIGDQYIDSAGNEYYSLSMQPIIVLAADSAVLGNIHRRALSRQLRLSLYIEEMFDTGHDAANRAVFSMFGPDTAKVVGLALRAEKKLVDKVTKGARMHA